VLKDALHSKHPPANIATSLAASGFGVPSNAGAGIRLMLLLAAKMLLVEKTSAVKVATKTLLDIGNWLITRFNFLR